MRKFFIILCIFSLNIFTSCKTDKNNRLVLNPKYMNQQVKIENGEMQISNYDFYLGKPNQNSAIAKLSLIEFAGETNYSIEDEIIKPKSENQKVDYYDINMYKQNFIENNFIYFVFKNENGKFISTFSNLNSDIKENFLFENERLKLVARCSNEDCSLVKFCFAKVNRSIIDGYRKFCVAAYEARVDSKSGGILTKYLYLDKNGFDAQHPFEVLNNNQDDKIIIMDIPSPTNFETNGN